MNNVAQRRRTHMNKISTLLFALVALTFGTFAIGSSANATCLFTTICGHNGPTVRGDVSKLTKPEQRLLRLHSIRRVSAADCEFRQFRTDGRRVANPVVFATDGSAFGCPQVASQKCTNCTAWVNGHRGTRMSGPAAAIRSSGGGVGRSVQGGTTGMWVPRSYRGPLGWCDLGISPWYASYAFAY